MLITNFLLQVCELLFLICVQKTVSMKILVLRVIKSYNDRESALYRVIFTCCCIKSPRSLSRTLLNQVFTQTICEYNPVRCTIYDIHYFYNIYNTCKGRNAPPESIRNMQGSLFTLATSCALSCFLTAIG